MDCTCTGSSPSASPSPSDSPAASPEDAPKSSPSPSPDTSSPAAASDSPAPPPPGSPLAQQAPAPVIVSQGNQSVTLQSSGSGGQQPIVVIFPQQGAPAPVQASPPQTVQLSKSGVGATPLPLQVNAGRASANSTSFGSVCTTVHPVPWRPSGV